MCAAKSKVFPLEGKVQSYAWGGTQFIPALLNLKNENEKPHAEYWLGAHHAAPSVLKSGSEEIMLPLKIQDNENELLGEDTARQFKRLPYLLKVLDVKDMLSIQVHPAKKDAEAAFAEEDHKGIPRNAPQRNYKDDNHKPELMLALSEFWLLHGFKPADLLEETLEHVPELKPLADVFSKGNYKALYAEVMTMPQQQVNKMLRPLLQQIVPLYNSGELQKSSAHFWAARASITYNRQEDIDRGIFSVYFFNLVNLHPGEAIFQDAGLPHAYLEGQNIEIMANSDNVLRGGLTPKHIDVPELLKHIRFEATIPDILHAGPPENGFRPFKTPARDFELGVAELAANTTLDVHASSADIFLCTEGHLNVCEKEMPCFDVKGGESFIAFYGSDFRITTSTDAVIYRASVPAPR